MLYFCSFLSRLKSSQTGYFQSFCCNFLYTIKKENISRITQKFYKHDLTNCEQFSTARAKLDSTLLVFRRKKKNLLKLQLIKGGRKKLADKIKQYSKYISSVFQPGGVAVRPRALAYYFSL